MQQRDHLPELDGLRGFLALWVVLAHILAWSGYEQFFLTQNVWLYALASNFIQASPAVDTFFILSGFLITLSLETSRSNYLHYLRKRFLRIYPVYLVCLIAGTLSLLYIPIITQQSLWHAAPYLQLNQAFLMAYFREPLTISLYHITLLQGLVPNISAYLLPPTWSITVEWQYYLFAPILSSITKHPLGVLCVALIAWFGQSVLYTLYAPPSLLPQKILLFAIGIASYRLYAARKQLHLPATTTSLVITALVAYAIATNSGSLLIWTCAIGYQFVDRSALPKFFVLVHDFLSSQPLQRAGRLSYPLYLIHWPVIICSLALLITTFPQVSQPFAVVFLMGVGIPLCLILSSLLTRFVEKPGIDYDRTLALMKKS